MSIKIRVFYQKKFFSRFRKRCATVRFVQLRLRVVHKKNSIDIELKKFILKKINPFILNLTIRITIWTILIWIYSIQFLVFFLFCFIFFNNQSNCYSLNSPFPIDTINSHWIWNLSTMSGFIIHLCSYFGWKNSTANTPEQFTNWKLWKTTYSFIFVIHLNYRNHLLFHFHSTIQRLIIVARHQTQFNRII